VAENFRPGTADKLGIGYEAVHEVNPEAVYLSISGFGNRQDPPSPYREWAAYAPIVEGMAGLYAYSQRQGEPPQMAVAGALGDTGPGLYAVIGLLAALHERQRTGTGSYVDISMYDSMVAIADIVHPASMGVDPTRVLEGIGILHAFRAADGWFSVEVVREPHFPRFAEAVGHPEWASDPSLASRASWSERMDDLIRPAVESWAATLTKLEASAALARKGVAAGPVNDAADIVSDPHVTQRDFVTHPIPGDSLAIVGNPIAFRPFRPEGEREQRPPARWPTLGRDTERILRERLDLPPREIESLREEGAIA
jgi:formyl-CoA transferase